MTENEHVKLTPRYYGDRTEEWMRTKEDNVKGDSCLCNGLDYYYNGEKWIIVNSIFNRKKSSDFNARLELYERLVDRLVARETTKMKNNSFDYSIVVLCGLIMMFTLGFILGSL